MVVRWFVRGGVALLVVALAGFGAWVLSLPRPATVQAAPVPRAETEAMLASLKPPKRERPLIAVVGLNDATETADYLMTTGILRRADVADVVLLSTGSGPVKLYPALTVQPDATLAQFDASHPGGADYVIVPAMSRDDDPAVLAWIQAQAKNGATIIGVCVGAKVVAAAGLLDGKRATTHWYVRKQMLQRHPSISYVADRRMVIDGAVATTTGITASMPMMLTLVEAIGGREKAAAVARDLDVATWDARHASGAFKFTRPFGVTVLGNVAAFWNHEKLGLELRPGMDEVSLALVADAWSRTYRSKVVAFSPQSGIVETRDGIRVVPDEVAAAWPASKRVADFSGQRPADALDRALEGIAARYGERTTNIVAMQLEYPRR